MTLGNGTKEFQGFDRLGTAEIMPLGVLSATPWGGGGPSNEERQMSTAEWTTETNLALARNYIDRVFNAHQPDLAMEYFTPTVKWHGGTLGTIEGPDNVVALLQNFIGGLPDLNAV